MDDPLRWSHGSLVVSFFKEPIFCLKVPQDMEKEQKLFLFSRCLGFFPLQGQSLPMDLLRQITWWAAGLLRSTKRWIPQILLWPFCFIRSHPGVGISTGHTKVLIHYTQTWTSVLADSTTVYSLLLYIRYNSLCHYNILPGTRLMHHTFHWNAQLFSSSHIQGRQVQKSHVSFSLEPIYQ